MGCLNVTVGDTANSTTMAYSPHNAPACVIPFQFQDDSLPEKVAQLSMSSICCLTGGALMVGSLIGLKVAKPHVKTIAVACVLYAIGAQLFLYGIRSLNINSSPVPNFSANDCWRRLNHIVGHLSSCITLPDRKDLRTLFASCISNATYPSGEAFVEQSYSCVTPYSPGDCNQKKDTHLIVVDGTLEQMFYSVSKILRLSPILSCRLDALQAP